MRIPVEWLREYLPADAAPRVLADRLAAAGLPVAEIEGAGDAAVLDVEVTANRPDCLSVIGIAREAALALGRPLRRPAALDPRHGLDGAALRGRPFGGRVRARAAGGRSAASRAPGGPVRVEIRDAVGCPRFTAAVIDGVRVGPSPDWMRRRLEAAGVRAINNVVDVTNYVMLETGQPMHAFDHAKVAGGRLVVRRARPGESLETLDGAVRVPGPQALVVADARHAISLGGIIGGRDTEIGPGTTAVLLEAAYWDPPAIARTGRRLGIRTEAGARFERGADPDGPPRAQARAAALLRDVCGGRPRPGMTDAYVRRVPRRVIRLRPERAAAVLGVTVTGREMIRVLRALGCAVRPGRVLVVEPPTFRPDLTREEDLIEEVVRVHGYDRVPPTLPRGDTTPGARSAPVAADRRVRDVLTRAGLTEVLTPTLVPAADGEAASLVPLANPLTKDQAALRGSLLPGVLAVLETNAARRLADVLVFELGRVFRSRGVGRRPEERRALAIAAMGRWRTGWNVPRDGSLVDLYHVRAILDTLLRELGLAEYEVAAPPAGSGPAGAGDEQPASAGPLPVPGTEPGSAGAARDGDAAARAGWWHPGRVADARVGGRLLARFGELHPDRVEHHRLPHRAYLGEVDLETAYALAAGAAAGDRRARNGGGAASPEPAPPTRITRPGLFAGLPRYPEVERDLAVVVAETLPAGRVEAIIRDAAGPLLETAELFDVYAGPPVPPGRRNLAYRLCLRAPDRTLTTEEAEEILERIRIAVRTRAGAELR